MERGLGVEIAGRLVGQQHARRVGDRARQRDALLLSPESSEGRWFSLSPRPR
jgi:hypothetical protein